MELNEKLLQKEYIKLKNLHQYRKYSEQKLRETAHNKVIEFQLNIKSLFVEKKDRNEASKLLEKYLYDYTPETVSDINTLRSILFLEILNFRLQDELNQDKKQKRPIDIKTVKTIHENLNQILVLKDSLGLIGNKNSAKSVDIKIGQMRKQFKVWLSNNQAGREVSCPFCRQEFLLRIRAESWEAQKHPFFKDRILGNKKLVKLFHQNKLTKKDVAEILECSPDYIDWLIEKWRLIPKEELT